MNYRVVTSTGDNPPVLTLNDQVVTTSYETKISQLFTVDTGKYEGYYHYYKETKALCRLTSKSYFSLITKIESLINREYLKSRTNGTQHQLQQ